MAGYEQADTAAHGYFLEAGVGGSVMRSALGRRAGDDLLNNVGPPRRFGQRTLRFRPAAPNICWPA